jgi:Tfp pilus assembly protein PilE
MLISVRILASLAAVALAGGLMAASPTVAQAQTQTQKPAQTQERIYGSQLMTEQERREYRDKLQAAKTVEERQKIRAAHHKAMLARAKERGVTLPDEPPPRAAKKPRQAAPSGGMGYGGAPKKPQ